MLIIKLGLGTGLKPNNFHDFRLTKTDNWRISTRFSTLPCIRGGWRVCQSEISIPCFYIYFVMFSVFCFLSTRPTQKSSIVRKLKYFLQVAREHNPGKSGHVTDLQHWPVIGWGGQVTRHWPLIGWGWTGPEPSCLVEPRMSWLLSDTCPQSSSSDGEYWLSNNIHLLCCSQCRDDQPGRNDRREEISHADSNIDHI